MERDRRRLLELESRPELGPTLRLYRWREPTVSLGWIQRPERALDLDRCRARGIPVVRRPTGGRAILHDDQWTYSAVVPIEDPRLGGRLEDSVRGLVETVRRALAAIGVEAGFAAPRRVRPTRVRGDDPTCFGAALGHELTVGGRKLLGSAQRRLARAWLQQGTILVGPGHERIAELVPGGAGERAALEDRLRAGTISLGEIRPEARDFAAFAGALERAWRQALGGELRGGRTLDTPGGST